MLILGLGSNLSSSYGDRFYNIDAAIKYLEIYGIKLISKSSYYETPSYPDKNNPKFINVVISAETKLPPEDLASVLLFIEEKLERKRKNKNDPRTCDIDIIDYNNQVLNFKYLDLDFFVPHQEISSRNFVLIPLNEIIPTWKHPKTDNSIAYLIDNLSNEEKNSILKIIKN